MELIDYSDVFGADIPKLPARRKAKRKQQTIKEQFEQFHKSNPFVYDLLCRFARQVKSKGIHNYSMQALLEQVRWHVTFEESYTWEPGKFKLNNNYASHYSRMVMDYEPDLHGMFSLRVLKAA